ncbi:MAG: hypothetical protein GVY04_15440 [Cyanobacteria bacterium]|nr:hypothetical protein [Cyanobacteria bacterium GSL.Bin1]
MSKIGQSFQAFRTGGFKGISARSCSLSYLPADRAKLAARGNRASAVV